MSNTTDTTPKGSIKQIRLEKARWHLATTWFPAGGIIFLLLIAQSLGGAYGDQVQRAWGWALPNFLPTLALMVSVFTSDALKPTTDKVTFVRKNFYYLALGLSIFYVITILMSLLVQPFLNPGNTSDLITARLELLEMSNIWLAPLQGLVVAALGVLFFIKEGNNE
ncbi:MAG: hypothetical protein ACWA5R_07075 [bacterium]